MLRHLIEKSNQQNKISASKDDASSFLVNKYSSKQISLAAPLYDIQHYYQEKDRQFLEYVGARNKDPDVWIRLAIKEYLDDRNVFLSDLRFLHVEKRGSGIDNNDFEDTELNYNDRTIEDFYKKLNGIFIGFIC